VIRPSPLTRAARLEAFESPTAPLPPPPRTSSVAARSSGGTRTNHRLTSIPMRTTRTPPASESSLKKMTMKSMSLKPTPSPVVVVASSSSSVSQRSRVVERHVVGIHNKTHGSGASSTSRASSSSSSSSVVCYQQDAWSVTLDMCDKIQLGHLTRN